MRRRILALLRRWLPEDWADDIVRDLEEAHGRRRRSRGDLRADLWLTGQAAAFALRFGAERLREAAERPRVGRALEVGAADARLALRSVRSAPGLFGAMILTLALGIGATTAVFSVVRNVLLAPLPLPDAHRLLVLEPSPWAPAAVVEAVRKAGAGLEAVEGSYPLRFAVTGGDGAREMEGVVVTPGFLPLLGARVAAGRGFAEADARPGVPAVAVLSHRVWRELGSPPLPGPTLRLNGRPVRVVGVLEPGFRPFTPRTDDPGIWTVAAPDRLGEGVLPEGSPPWAIPVARLRPGVEVERAREALEAAAARYAADHPDVVPGGARWSPRWIPAQQAVVGDVRDGLLLLQGAGGALLLLACINVATLLLVRLAARRREMAVRTAVGASRGRLLRQLLTESAVLGALGGMVGVAVATLLLEGVVALAPADVPRLEAVALDLPVLLFAAAVSLGTGLLFGTVPALSVASEAPRGTLRESPRTATAGRSRHRLSQGLVVAQVALTLVLVVAAGLLARSFASLAGRDPGIRTRDVRAVRITAPEHRHGSVPELGRFQAELLRSLGQAPGVEAVALANNLPLERGSALRDVVVEGEDEPRPAEFGVVSPGYLETLEIPLRQGRGLAQEDREDGPRVAVVDEVLAREAWPGEDPVGRRFRLEGSEAWITVVGVSAAVRGGGLEREPGPGFYIPYTQRPRDPVELGVGREMVVLVRSRAAPAELTPALRAAVQAVDPGQPVPPVESLDRIVAERLGPWRFRAALVGLFGGLALALAVSGIGGVVGHLVAQRTREVGIRRALGAGDGDVARSVLGRGLALAVAGVAVGLLALPLTGHLLRGSLVGVEPLDPTTVGAATVLVTAAAVGACLVPARRALRIDPLEAVRSDA